MTQALTRAVAVYRILALGYAAALIVDDHDHYSRPGVGWVVLSAMVAWTVVAIVAYDRLASLPRWLVALDVAVAVAAVLLTLAVEPQQRIDAGVATLPAAWAAAPVMMAAVAGGPWLGGAAAVAVSAADVAERGVLTQRTFNGVVLLLLTGVVGGYVVRLGKQAEAVIDAAARRDAATAERDRLAREIHDSTLQVLALVARRGAELGGESAKLAALAAEQEVALRRLVATEPVGTAAEGEVDLRDLLGTLASSRVEVAAPASAVPLPREHALAVAAAVAEALANIDRHAGEGASVWILVDDAGDQVTVNVRDDGVGFAADRLAAAADEGRLGVAQSIMGRIAAVGGTATVTSTPGSGTEVELVVSR
jgi:signal transduction histidine kinase